MHTIFLEFAWYENLTILVNFLESSKKEFVFSGMLKEFGKFELDNSKPPGDYDKNQFSTRRTFSCELSSNWSLNFNVALHFK